MPPTPCGPVCLWCTLLLLVGCAGATPRLMYQRLMNQQHAQRRLLVRFPAAVGPWSPFCEIIVRGVLSCCCCCCSHAQARGTGGLVRHAALANGFRL